MVDMDLGDKATQHIKRQFAAMIMRGDTRFNISFIKSFYFMY
jgi:hypothetical protein